MGKNLVIVESPAKCRTISRYLGKDYSVKATMGHIIDLPEKELGVDIAHDFKPKYTASKGKRRIIKALREDASKADAVFLAPDPDREGEAIAWHVTQAIAKNNTNVKRVLFNEITKRAVLNAFANPKDIDMHKVNAQQARRILDRIVGYQVSPVLWRTVYRRSRRKNTGRYWLFGSIPVLRSPPSSRRWTGRSRILPTGPLPKRYSHGWGAGLLSFRT